MLYHILNMFSIKGKNISPVGMGSKKLDDMELDVKNGMNQVEYCYEGFDSKTLFLHISVQDILIKEYDVMGGYYGRVLVDFNFNLISGNKKWNFIPANTRHGIKLKFVIF